jgi:hypothetical protein
MATDEALAAGTPHLNERRMIDEPVTSTLAVLPSPRCSPT